MPKVPFSANARNADTHSTGATTANPIPVHAFHLPRSAGRTRISFSARDRGDDRRWRQHREQQQEAEHEPGGADASDRSALRLELGGGSAAVTMPGGVAGDLPVHLTAHP